MEKVFIRIVGEGGDEDLDTDATNAMGRSVAQALQDDQEEDLELARDLAAVGFDEPRDCCGILTRFGHASLARYSCAMCCGTYVYWCMGLFIQGIIPWLFCCWFCELWCVCGVWHWVCYCVEIKVLRHVRAESWPPRHRRDAGSIAWRCRFLTARPSQHGRVIAEM